jgi:hypothetical protein
VGPDPFAFLPAGEHLFFTAFAQLSLVSIDAGARAECATVFYLRD